MDGTPAKRIRSNTIASDAESDISSSEGIFCTAGNMQFQSFAFGTKTAVVMQQPQGYNFYGEPSSNETAVAPATQEFDVDQAVLDTSSSSLPVVPDFQFYDLLGNLADPYFLNNPGADGHVLTVFQNDDPSAFDWLNGNSDQNGAVSPADGHDSGNASWYGMQGQMNVPSPCTTEDFEGQYGFDIGFPNLKGKEWVFKADEGKLYAKDGVFVDTDLATQKKPEPLMKVRVSAYFCAQGTYGKAVTPCPQHGANGSGYYLESNVANVIREQDGSLSVPFTASKNSNRYSVLGYFSACCKNSCFKNKTVIKMCFELIDARGTVVGKRSIDLRVCACPSRDAGHVQPKSNKKRKTAEPEPQNVVAKPEPAAKIDQRNSALYKGCEELKGMAEKGKYGVFDHAKRDENGDIVYSLHARVPKQLLDLAKQMHGLCKNADLILGLTTGEKKPEDFMKGGATGYSAHVVHPGTNQKRKTDEIQRWIHDVVGVSCVSAKAFQDAGYPTLDAVFGMKVEDVERVLPDVSTAIHEKIRKALPERIEPQASTLSRWDSSGSQSIFSQ